MKEIQEGDMAVLTLGLYTAKIVTAVIVYRCVRKRNIAVVLVRYLGYLKKWSSFRSN